MAEKRTMTLNLTETEMEVLEELAQSRDMTKTAVIRQAIRLYQLLEYRIAKGESFSLSTARKRKRS